MEYQGVTLATSAEKVMEKLNDLGGNGGFIAVDKKGQFVMPFNTEGMFRGVANSKGLEKVEMF